MPARQVSALLLHTASLSALTRASRHIALLQQLYILCAPFELTQASRVAHYRDGILVIAADNGAIALKLKQVTPRLLRQLQNRTVEITGIKVEVQVGRRQQTAKSVNKLALLPIDIIEEIERLVRRVKNPELRTALVRFANRRRG